MRHRAAHHGGTASIEALPVRKTADHSLSTWRGASRASLHRRQARRASSRGLDFGDVSLRRAASHRALCGRRHCWRARAEGLDMVGKPPKSL
jgi:hypothetical protein